MIKIKKKVCSLIVLAGLIPALCMLASCRANDGKAITSYDQLDEPGMKVGVGLNCPWDV